MNIARSIMQLYPNADPVFDFEVRDDSDGTGPYIAIWNVKDADGNPVPEPTEAELLAAWEAYQANPPTPAPSEVDILGMQMVERELELLAARSEIDFLGAQLVAMDLRLLQGGM